MNPSLARGRGFISVPDVIVILRLIGVLNAALWFGAAIFFTFWVAPTIFTPEFKRMLGSSGEAWAGLIAQAVLRKYFVLSYFCGGIALAHMVAEWLYLGKAIQKWTVTILVGAFSLGLLGGVWLQPKLSQLHIVKYNYTGNATTLQRAHAARSFSFWHGVSQVMNLAVLAGLGAYVFRLSHPPEVPRFVSSGKFRS
jgi:hypothetical protein